MDTESTILSLPFSVELVEVEDDEVDADDEVQDIWELF